MRGKNKYLGYFFDSTQKNSNFVAHKERNMCDKEEQIWFAVGCTSPQKELRVRDDARQYGLEAFVPLKYEVKTVRGQKQRALVPALAGLMFVKGTEEEVKDYIRNFAHYNVYIRKSNFSNKEDYLTVPTKAMENFIAVTEHREEKITFFRPEEISLQQGDKIRIRGGLYDGREGVIMRIKGKRNKHLVVQIPGVLIAAVELEPEMLELVDSTQITQKAQKDNKGTRISRIARNNKVLDKGTRISTNTAKESQLREKPSKNIDKDKILLMEFTQRLLFEIPDKYQQENEYYLLLSEMRRCRERLKTFKGFTATTEAELALPMYLAAVKLQEGVTEAEMRLKNAIEKLKDTSKLKALCIEMLEKTSHRNH